MDVVKMNLELVRNFHFRKAKLNKAELAKFSKMARMTSFDEGKRKQFQRQADMARTAKRVHERFVAFLTAAIDERSKDGTQENTED